MKSIRLSSKVWADLVLCKNSFNKLGGDHVSIGTIVEGLVNRHLSAYLSSELSKRTAKLKKEHARREAIIKKHVKSIEDVSYLYKKSATNADLLVK